MPPPARTKAPPPGSGFRLVTWCFLLSAACFGFDLAHWIVHSIQDPELWHAPGFSLRLGLKGLVFLAPLAGLAFLRFRTGRLAALGLVFLLLGPPRAFAADAEACRQARRFFEKSGMARDASEDFFGRIKRKPPSGSFPPDTDQVTWWGEFKPFEFWDSPEFESVWVSPRGTEAARKPFRGKKCRLAKSTLHAHEQPRGLFEPGMWEVRIQCGGEMIDRQSFAVVPHTGGRTVPDRQTPSTDHTMIWAEEAVKKR